jgi:hypothetical protein
VKIAIRTVKDPGTQTVDALPVGVPGLAAHAAPGAAGWIITHVRSGNAVLWFPEASPEAVLAAARQLAPLTDWAAPASQINRRKVGPLVCEVGDRWGGRTYFAGQDPVLDDVGVAS